MTFMMENEIRWLIFTCLEQFYLLSVLEIEFI